MTTAYAFALFAHSYLRWAIVAAFIVVIGGGAVGWWRASPWFPFHERAHAALVGLADLQLTIGIVLYVFLSPVASAFFHDPAVAMKEHTLRFFGLEHPTMMFLAVALLHIGRKRTDRASTGRDKHRAATQWTLAAFVVVLSSIPWPGLRHGRPLMRGFASYRQTAGDSLTSIGGSGGGPISRSNANSPSLSELSRSFVANTSSP